ncbi:MAG: ABC transporter ATP-binding protein [Pirellulales bacterium]|nr:ABC transporter ATP-binding protein [Pirellulales bacterium]
MHAENFAVELSQLTKRFGKSTAVDSLSLQVPRGVTLGLLGPNGAGKSTTLKMLMGMLRPTAGAVRVLGHDVFQSAPDAKQRIGYVPDSAQIYRWMSVAAALRFSAALYKNSNGDLCEELMDLFKLPKRRRVRGLSKGMLAKLSLVIALAHEPELIVLDEPLSGLDPIARDEFLEGVMREICAGDRTVLFSSHQLEEVSRLADSVAIIAAGKILVHHQMEELLHRTRRVRAVLCDGRLPTAVPENTIWQRVNRREWLMTIHPYSEATLDQIGRDNEVNDVQVSNLSLEEVFKDFVRGEQS